MSDPTAPPTDNPYVSDPDTDFSPVEELSRESAIEQTEELRDAIRYHDHRYYVENDPVIADRTYDELFDRLKDLEDAFDLQTPDSPTQRVGGEPVDELGTVEHVAPMLSIDSGGDDEAARDFDERVRRTVPEVEYVCEPKFDGLSLEVVYVDGTYERAATRGDGETGEDVTENVRTIASVPLRLRGDPPSFLAVRGEVYIPRDAFHAMNRERIEAGDDPFANPRNAAAGTLRQLDPSVTASRPLQVFFYDILAAGESETAVADTDASRGALGAAGIDTHWEEHKRLPEWGLRVNDRVEVVTDIGDAIEYRDRLLEDRDDLNFEVDGAVFKVNDREACQRLGSTSRHYRWAFAYKFPPRSDTTTITDVVVQVGRTGRLTPVALLDPVDVGGVTVSRASLHNQSEIEEMGVDVGDEVRIERAGDVIPYVSEVIESHSEGHFDFPDTCPVCDSPVERDGPLHFCTGGLQCPAQLVRAVAYYGSDDGLDIEGLGENTAQTLVEEGLIEDDLADLYDLTREDLATLEGFGEQSAENLLEELDASKHPPLPDFLAAIGIPEVGPTVARDLARHFSTLDAVMDASVEELQAVEGIGATVAEHIVEFFSNERNRRAIRRLRERGVDPEPVEGDGGEELSGLTVVFTGSVEGWTRDELQDLVERHGGNATSTVSGNTDFLVAGENPGQSKRADAEDEDVPILDPQAFFEELRDRGVTVD
ncbi:MAG: NAD-dependent DNA ligase LigA [Halodesulfurarchaeum sp.]